MLTGFGKISLLDEVMAPETCLGWKGFVGALRIMLHKKRTDRLIVTKGWCL